VRTSYLVAAILALAFGVHGVMMVFAVPFMRAAAASVGFSVAKYRLIGALEVAAAIGVIAGLVVPVLGIAAGTGLVALMVAALIVHVRNSDSVRRMVPAIVLGLTALGYVALLLAQFR
jgi:DoxX-like protein